MLLPEPGGHGGAAPADGHQGHAEGERHEAPEGLVRQAVLARKEDHGGKQGCPAVGQHLKAGRKRTCPWLQRPTRHIYLHASFNQSLLSYPIQKETSRKWMQMATFGLRVGVKSVSCGRARVASSLSDAPRSNRPSRPHTWIPRLAQKHLEPPNFSA